MSPEEREIRQREANARYRKTHSVVRAATCKAWRAANPLKRNEYRKANAAKIKKDNAAYRASHVNERKAYNADFHIANRNKINTSHKARREANIVAAKCREAAYRAANKDKIKISVMVWQKANPDKCRAFARNRRARILCAEGAHSAADTNRIRLAQRNRCAYCRESLGRRGHLDHIKPLARGGSNWPSNLQWLCVACNLSKSAKDPIDFAHTIELLV